MNFQREITPKVKGLLTHALLLLGIAFIAVFIYVSYVSYSTEETVASGILSMLLISLLGVLLAFSLIVFSVIAKKTHPIVARMVPLTFFVATYGYLIFLMIVDRYGYDFRKVKFYLIFCLIVSMLLNIIIYFRNQKLLSAK
jgi:hypothetical protein